MRVPTQSIAAQMEGVYLSLLGTFILAIMATIAPSIVVIRQPVKEAIVYD